ncbi:PREDICTED: venom allergen 5-like [Nicrophorus vespilloides]|uniref:Venom allergen 5-like n=1 Tax=Nicrophorus vespilloides TaxID=110193 RepID=A0ABM1MHK3_NICVS|nr:PREDICTED: venom allergen 5-like [Nicrophorus vespilloides]
MVVLCSNHAMLLQLIILSASAAFAVAENCPSGGQIYARGISQQGKNDVTAAHNNFRKMIANGQVPNQPRGVNLKRMYYDDNLGNGGRIVSNTCKMSHIIMKDNRWGWVGQNLYVEWNSAKENNPVQNWSKVVTSWFNEHKDFRYPNTAVSGKQVGHYTQVVWADSNYVGCDFIYYYDVNQPKYPYAKLYTCNYGPGGNYNNQAPYRTGSSGCENLC